MKRAYIERGEAFSAVQEHFQNGGFKSYADAQACLNLIKDIPAADVELVRHGRWVKMTGMMPPEFHGHYACSECGWSGKNFLNELQFRRCPECGAKMDVELPKEDI